MIPPISFPTLFAIIFFLAYAGTGRTEPAPGGPANAPNAPAAVPAEASPVAGWLRSISDVDAKLYAAVEDLKTRTDHRRVLPGGPPSKKAPFLRTQLDELEKRTAILRVEIAMIAKYKAAHPQLWREDWENQFLELQISEQSISANLAELQQRLAEKRHWWELGR